MWDASKCNLCGDCLVKCPYVDYDRDKAVAQIKLLIEDKKAEILDKCLTCFACNEYCPTGADPFDLVVKMKEKTGVSAAGVEGFSHWINNIPNELVPGEPDRPILSLCVMESAYPEGAFDGQIFKGMPVVKGRDYFGWFGYLHFFKESLVMENAQRFVDIMAGLGKDIVFPHDDCYSMVHYVVKDYGITVPFKYMHIFEYLRNYLRDHRRSIVKLRKRIAYQRPCASRYTPEKDALLEEIFELIGVERPQRRFDLENALCCMGGSSGTYPELAKEFQSKNMNDAIESGCEALINSCAGCDSTLRKPALQVGLKPIFITELCSIALGEKPWPE